MGYPRTTPKVLEFINNRRDQDLTVGVIAEAVGLDTGQVRASMRQLIDRDGLNITVLVRGQQWRYPSDVASAPVPAPVAAPKVAPGANRSERDREFTWVGRSSKGEHIVRGNFSNLLYVLDEVEI